MTRLVASSFHPSLCPNDAVNGSEPMPVFASFEGLSEFAIVAAFLFLTWASAAILAVIALALAFSDRRRRVSRGCAIACVVASAPIGLFDASLPFRSIGPGDPIGGWPFLVVTLAPLIIGAGVLWFGQHCLRKE